MNNSSVLNDVWSSSDGVTWTQVTSAASWSGRYRFGALAYSNQMWVLGGCTAISTATYTNDVWFSQPTFAIMLGSYYLYQKQ